MARYGDEFYGLEEYGADTLVDFDVSPFIVSSRDYNKIFVQWNTPTGAWDSLRLVRNGFGFPVTPDDGDLLFEGGTTDTTRSYVDVGQVPNNSGLIEGRTYYYSIFVRETSTSTWRMAGSNLGVSVKNYGTADLMYEYLPTAYKISNVYSITDNDTDINNDLYNFLKVFAFEHDFFKTTVENVKNRYNPITLDGRLIPVLLNEFGFSYEREIGLQRARTLLQNAIKIYSEKGSLSGLKTFVTAFTGFNCEVAFPKNLMLDYNNSTFRESLGFWEGATNATIVRGTPFSETPGVAPYLEPGSPANFPNSIAGFLKVTAVGAGNVVMKCGSLAPLTRGVPVIAGTSYVFTGYIRSKTISRNVQLKLDWYDRFGDFISSTSASTTATGIGSWSRSTATTGTAPSDAYYAIPVVTVVGCSSGEIHYFDAFQIEEGSTATTFSDARRVDVTLRANRINQLLNPSFENSLDNWLVEGGTAALDSNGAVDGSNYSLEITSSGTASCYATSVNRVDVQAEDQNAFSAYVKGDAGVTARLSIIWYNQANSTIGAETTPFQTLSPSSWTRLAFTALSPATAVTANVSVEFVPTAANDVMYLDAVMFEKASFVVDYFDGSTGYQQTGDLIWENGDPVSGRSHYYKNREVVTKRLFSVLPEYLPTGSPWAVFVAQPD